MGCVPPQKPQQASIRHVIPTHYVPVVAKPALQSELSASQSAPKASVVKKMEKLEDKPLSNPIQNKPKQVEEVAVAPEKQLSEEEKRRYEAQLYMPRQEQTIRVITRIEVPRVAVQLI